MKTRFQQQSAVFNKYRAPTLVIEDKQISSLLRHTREGWVVTFQEIPSNGTKNE